MHTTCKFTYNVCFNNGRLHRKILVVYNNVSNDNQNKYLSLV